MSNNTTREMMLGPGPDDGAVQQPVTTQVTYAPTSAQPMLDAAESAKMTPQILVLLVLTGLKRCWKWALPTGIVLGLAAATLLWYLFPVKYEAKAWIQILFEKPYYVFNEKISQQYEQYVNTQFEIIRSPLILKKVLEAPAVGRSPEVMKQKDPITWIAKNLILQSQNKSEIITIAMKMKEANQAQVIVNQVVDVFIEYNRQQVQGWNDRLIHQLQIEQQRRVADANFLQGQINRSLEKASKAGGTQNKEGTFRVEDSIQRDVYIAEGELAKLTSAKEMIEQMLRDNTITPPEGILQAAIQNEPALQQLNMQLTALIDERDERTAKNPGDRRIVRIETEIKEVEMRRNRLMQQLSASKPQELTDQLKQTLEESLFQKQMEVRSQKVLVEKLKQRRDEQVTNTTGAVLDLADVTFKQAELARINTVLDQLATRIVALQTESAAPPRVQPRERASLPTEPDTRQKYMFVAVGTTACFFFPFFLGIALERMRPRLYHVSQVRAAIPRILIGEIMEPPVAWVHGSMFRKRLARYRESVHSWCTHLLLSHPFNRCRTFAIASVAGDDGKTFLAIQVAVAMAQMKSGPVLLIDGDMRVGRLHLLFGNEEPGIGLADILSFRKGIGEAIVLNEKEPNLHLLTSGHLDVSPYELLGDGRFRELLDTLEKHYDLIMVVLPPVANAAESLVMAQSVDSVLLCVRQGETVLAAMEDVFRKLVNTGSNVDGIVVKDIPYYQMAGKDGGFADKVEQIRLAHLLQYSE